uniref:Uncharacterized protein n=1 Tax=Romanomermis culicivorax TaxID=13658 RepID=A0A915I238_ROMCU
MRKLFKYNLPSHGRYPNIEHYRPEPYLTIANNRDKIAYSMSYPNRLSLRRISRVIVVGAC